MNSQDNQNLVDETMIERVVDKVMGGKTNIILDATILSTIMACPRLADFRFNLNLHSISGKSNSLECGSIVHKFLEVYYQSIIDGARKEQARGFAFAGAELYITGCKFCTDFVSTPEQPKPICGHKANDYPGVKNTPKESEGNLTGWHYVLDTCDQYLIFWKNDHWVPLETETVHGEVLYEDDEIRILWKAKLDIVWDTNQGIFPGDHKTMKQRRKDNSMSNQFMGQCLLMKCQKVFKNKVGFQSSLKPEEKFTRPPINYSSTRLIEWQSQTLPYYAKLLMMYAESGHFPPNFNHCEGKYGDCAFYEHVCSSDPEMREQGIKAHFYVGPEWNPTNDED